MSPNDYTWSLSNTPPAAEREPLDPSDVPTSTHSGIHWIIPAALIVALAVIAGLAIVSYEGSRSGTAAPVVDTNGTPAPVSGRSGTVAPISGGGGPTPNYCAVYTATHMDRELILQEAAAGGPSDDSTPKYWAAMGQIYYNRMDAAPAFLKADLAVLITDIGLTPKLSDAESDAKSVTALNTYTVNTCSQPGDY